MDMKIIYLENVTQKEAEDKARELGGRIPTNREMDFFLQQKPFILNPDLFPVWTSTRFDYDGEICALTEGEETLKVAIPKKDGWYLQDKFGFPSGAPSDSGNPEARYLWRKSKNSGLVARYYYGWVGRGRRGVVADYWPDGRLGVFVFIR